MKGFMTVFAVALALMLAGCGGGGTASMTPTQTLPALASAGPFGVSMGDPLKAKGGWGYLEIDRGIHSVRKSYKGELPFRYIWKEGTGEHGVCRVLATKVDVRFPLRYEEPKKVWETLLKYGKRMSRKHGKPSGVDQGTFYVLEALTRKYGVPSGFDKETVSAYWELAENLEKLDSVLLMPSIRTLAYHFENVQECQAVRKAKEEAERKAKVKGMGKDL